MKANSLLSIVMLLLSSIGASSAVANAYSENNILLRDVVINKHATADISINVTTSESDFCRNSNTSSHKNIVTIHGIAHTAATWRPLTKELINDNPESELACNILSIDLPGHGNSAFPKNMLYGDMSFHDYANSIINTIDRLQVIGFKTPTIFAFSHAGFLLQVAQQTLIDKGTNLHKKLGVKNAVFFGPSLPQPLSWWFSESGVGADFMSQFYQESDSLGIHVSIPDAVWRQLWFSNKKGELATGAPSLEVMAEYGYNTFESGTTLSQLLSAAPFVRPYVSEGVYSPMYVTKLTILGYSNDLYMSTEETTTLYEYLTGDYNSKNLVLIDNEQAVHNYHMAEPRDTLEKVKEKVHL